MKKKVIKQLEKLVSELPPMFTTVNEVMDGYEVIDELKKSPTYKEGDPLVDGSGKEINEKTKYYRKKPVPVNHLARLKDAYQRGGMTAVGFYALDCWKQTKEADAQSLLPPVESEPIAVEDNSAVEIIKEPKDKDPE
jgi:hypothetical protein